MQAGTVSRADPGRSVSIADISIRMVEADQGMAIALNERTGAFCAEVPQPDVELKVRWGIPKLEPSASTLFDSGAVWRLYRQSDQYVFQFATPFFGPSAYKSAWFSSDFGHGNVFLRPDAFPTRPVDPLEYPLDELLMVHLLSEGRGIEVHATGLIDESGEGSLFLGHSGAGKSTLSQILEDSGRGRILSDDRIIIRRVDGDFWIYGTPWHGEKQFSLNKRARLRRIFVIKHGAENKRTSIPRMSGVAMLIARSFLPFHSASGVEYCLSFCDQIVGAVPCEELHFRPDPSVLAILQS